VIALALVGLAFAAPEEPDPGADRCGWRPLGEGAGVNLVGGTDIAAIKDFAPVSFLRGDKGAIDRAKAEVERRAEAKARAVLCATTRNKQDCDAELAGAMRGVALLPNDTDPQYVCAAVGKPASEVGAASAAGRAVRAVTSLGQAVAVGLREAGVRTPVRLDVVKNGSRCSVPELAAARTSLGAVLGQQKLQLLDGAPTADTWTVELEATPAGADIQLAATLVPPGRKARVPVGVQPFPNYAYGSVDLTRACVVPVEPRAGDGGLQVSFGNLPEQVCIGQELRPTLSVSAPARVEVWSVLPDGTGLLVVPGLEPGGAKVNGRWAAGTRPLPAASAIPAGMSGDETLVAIAVPDSAPVGASAPASFCKVLDVGAKRIPAGAAVAAQSFRVVDTEGRCPLATQAQAQVDSLKQVLRDAPICP
jgi:hypothetical protein